MKLCEPPILDGSSRPWLMILEAEPIEQEREFF